MNSAQPFSILIVDDDKAMRQSLQELLQAAGWRVEAASRAMVALDRLESFSPDVILSDVRMPGMSGLELLAELVRRPVTPPLVLISAHGDIPMAVSAMQDGAYSFVEKPYEPRRLLSILSHAAEQNRMQQSNNRLKQRLFQLSGLDRVLLGETRGIAELRHQILDYAALDAAVLIEGETGTGKEVAARALHDLSPRADRPFLALNCAVLVPETFETEMFGVAGDRDGRLLAASGGTLFLDEVVTCPLPVQAKLLRLIEDGQILPVGAAEPVSVDLRVVSATNVDAEQAVRDGVLRQDLLYRLNSFVLTLPPLRQRREDVPLLAAHFLADYARLHECRAPEVTQDDLSVLLAHDWPGNVRELRSACERRVLAARRGAGSMADAMRTEQTFEEVPGTLREAVASFERELIARALKAHEGRMDDVAGALGIGRRTLNEKIVKLGLDKNALL